MFLLSKNKSILIIWLIGAPLLGSPIKDTTNIIREWVVTEQIIGEESTEWNIEKEALHDIRNALVKELEELDQRLAESEEEAVGAAKQRAELMEKKEEIEETTYSILEGVEQLQNHIDETFKLLPTPLIKRLEPFREKISLEISDTNLPLRQRVDTLISLMQTISLFHRNVSLERQEFSLEDNVSREFQVIYFGLGIAYFVNESGTVAGYGSPSEAGWIWNRQDALAQEISIGVDILNNRAMPRFLNLPFPEPKEFKK